MTQEQRKCWNLEHFSFHFSVFTTPAVWVELHLFLVSEEVQRLSWLKHVFLDFLTVAFCPLGLWDLLSRLRQTCVSVV